MHDRVIQATPDTKRDRIKRKRARLSIGGIGGSAILYEVRGTRCLSVSGTPAERRTRTIAHELQIRGEATVLVRVRTRRDRTKDLRALFAPMAIVELIEKRYRPMDPDDKFMADLTDDPLGAALSDDQFFDLFGPRILHRDDPP